MHFGFRGLAVFAWFCLVLNAPSSGLAVTRYVDVNSLNPLPPYTDAAHAAVTIQDAVDVSSDGDLVLVDEGVYQTGGRAVESPLPSRVAIESAITVRSVHGAMTTTIKGQGPLGPSAVRCAFVGTGGASPTVR